MIDPDWFPKRRTKSYPSVIKDCGIVLSIYSPHFITGTNKPIESEYTAGITIGVFKNEKDKINLILFSVFPNTILDSYDLIIHTENLSYDFMNNSKKKTYMDRAPHVITVPAQDSKLNSIALQVIRNNSDARIMGLSPDRHGSNLNEMLTKALPIIKSKKMWVMTKTEDPNTLRNVDESFLEIISGYPSLESEPLVYALVQAILFLNNGNIFNDDEDKIKGDGILRPRHGFYGPGQF